MDNVNKLVIELKSLTDRINIVIEELTKQECSVELEITDLRSMSSGAKSFILVPHVRKKIL